MKVKYFIGPVSNVETDVNNFLSDITSNGETYYTEDFEIDVTNDKMFVKYTYGQKPETAMYPVGEEGSMNTFMNNKIEINKEVVSTTNGDFYVIEYTS